MQLLWTIASKFFSHLLFSTVFLGRGIQWNVKMSIGFIAKNKCDVTHQSFETYSEGEKIYPN